MVPAGDGAGAAAIAKIQKKDAKKLALCPQRMGCREESHFNMSENPTWLEAPLIHATKCFAIQQSTYNMIVELKTLYVNRLFIFFVFVGASADFTRKECFRAQNTSFGVSILPRNTLDKPVRGVENGPGVGDKQSLETKDTAPHV